MIERALGPGSLRAVGAAGWAVEQLLLPLWHQRCWLWLLLGRAGGGGLAATLKPTTLRPACLGVSGPPLQGQVKGDTRITCTACAGTLLLEFGVLSRLTGNLTYEEKARHAVETIHSMRSSRWAGGRAGAKCAR